MTRLYLLVPLIVACGNSTPPGDGGTDASTGNDASPTDSAVKDVATSDAGDAACPAPQGATCPTTAGNCKGIGTPCTTGGGQCNPSGTSCDKDLDGDAGAGVCITIFQCTRGNHDCGNGASCCNTPMTSNVSVCLPNQCLPSDCTPE